MQPYHELYPSQAAIFGLAPRFVTLREDRRAGTWRLDRDELRAALTHPAVKAMVVNTPQNPTGTVLDAEDLGFIAELCRAHDRFAITDEIYEHITFDGHRHRCLARFDGMAERTLVVNAISKTGRATGWRVGWVITPPDRTPALRAVHDNLVVQAPTPLQKGAVTLLRQPRSFFAGIAEGYREREGPAGRRPARRSGSRRPRRRARTTCSRTTAACPRSPRCRRPRPPCISSSKREWRRFRATTSTPPDGRGTVTCDSPSADRFRRCRTPSNGSVQSFANAGHGCRSMNREMGSRWSDSLSSRRAGSPR